MQKFNVLDLFCGAGGMTEGFFQAGFYVPFASDKSKEATETYKNRHKQLGYELSFYEGDIKDLTKKATLCDFINNNKIDVVVGGPPCQGFSLTGKRADNDPRNELFLDYLKIVKLVQPKYFVMENVEGILSYKFKKIKGISGSIYTNITVPEIIKKEAFNFGYEVQYKLLNSKNFGVPQHRLRVIFIGNRIMKNIIIPNFPKQSNNVIFVGEALSDLRFLKNGQKANKYDNRYKPTNYQKMLRNGLTPDVNGNPIKSEILTNHQASKHKFKTQERFKLLNPGESILELLGRLDVESYEKYYTKKYRCSKLHINSVSPTVLTLPDDIVHYDNDNPRILTVRELARLQSFDDSFEFLGKRTTGGQKRKYDTPQYSQVGNAVPPLMAFAIAKELMKALQYTEFLLNNEKVI